MKTMNYRTYFCKFGLLTALLATGMFMACSSDDDTAGQTVPGHIEIKGYDAATGYTVGAAGTEITGEKLDIDAKGVWQFIAEDEIEDEWVRIFPDRGTDEGVIHVIVREDRLFQPKNARFKILLDGEEQSTAFTVYQEAGHPYLTITDDEEIRLQPDARKLSLAIRSNVDYKVSEIYEGTASDWLTERMISENGVVSYQVLANESVESRTVKFAVKATEFDNLNAEVSITQLRTRQVAGFPVKWLFSKDIYSKYQKDFVDNNFVKPEEGTGKISYMPNADNTSPDRRVGSTGHPTFYGSLSGDYWIFEAQTEEDIPANSVVHVKFITRSSKTGARYWILEYLDGSDWKPFGEKRTLSEEGERVEYTLDLVADLLAPQTVGQSNAMIDSYLTLTSPIRAQGSVQIRYRCVSDMNCAGNPLTAGHSGTSRIAGAASGELMPSPEIDVCRPAEEGTLPEQDAENSL